jgi:hypothetical protein
MQTGPAGAAQDVLPTAVKIHPRLGDWLSNNQAKQLLWLHMRQNASWTWAYVVVPSLNCVISGALPKGCAVTRRYGVCSPTSRISAPRSWKLGLMMPQQSVPWAIPVRRAKMSLDLRAPRCHEMPTAVQDAASTVPTSRW